MKENDANPNRRSFIKGAAAAGLLGAVGSSPAISEPAQTTPAEEEPQAPPGLGTAGLLDQRYPVSYQTSIPAAVKVITDYFAALSRRDPKGMAEQCHFPFVTFEGTTVIVVNGADELLSNAPASMNTVATGERWADHGSYMATGCYDIFGGLEILNSNPVCANLSLVYNRYNSSGHIILQCQGVYVVTNNDGKWGIELMSTIFTPGDLIGKVYNETIEAGLRGRIIHDIGPNTNDSDADLYDYQYGTSVTVSVGGGGFFGVRGPNEDAMASFRTNGAKSRLRIREIKAGSVSPDALLNIVQSGGRVNNPNDVAKYKDDWSWYRAMFKRTGLGEVGMVFDPALLARPSRGSRQGACVHGNHALYSGRGSDQLTGRNRYRYVEKRTLGSGEHGRPRHDAGPRKRSTPYWSLKPSTNWLGLQGTPHTGCAPSGFARKITGHARDRAESRTCGERLRRNVNRLN